MTNKLFFILVIISLSVICFGAADYDEPTGATLHTAFPGQLRDNISQIGMMRQGASNTPAGEITYDTDEMRFEEYTGSAYVMLDQAEIGSTTEVTVEVLCSSEIRITAYPEAALVVNESSLDRDFRIEGNGNANLFFCDAGNNRIGMGTGTPTLKLTVNGAINSGVAACTASSDNFDVSGCNILTVNASGGNLVLGGLSGGEAGQLLYIAKTGSANAIIIEHAEASGTEKFYTQTASDYTIPAGGFGGVMCACPTGSFWVVANTN